MGITTIRDLLFHFPRTYQDLSKLTTINKVSAGNEYCIEATVVEIKEVRTYQKRMSLTNAVVEDKTGAIKAMWFNQPYLKTAFAAGDTVYLAGKVARGKEGIYLSNPSYEKKGDNESIHSNRIIPIYDTTFGVSSKWLRYAIHTILAQLKNTGQETLPEDILKEKGFPPLKTALEHIHFPESQKQADTAKKRFAFEELFSILLFVITERKKIASVKAPPVEFDPDIMKRFTDKLEFTLTDQQKKAAWSILKDIEQPRPMNRLLQGDVGSGKTVVAAMAALSAIRAGYQVSFMAPTEILVQQHFKTIAALLTPFKVTIGLLTGKTDRFISPKLPNDYIEISRKKLLEHIKEGEIDILIGTHTLVQDKVKFGNLALVVLDEQHRFGVKQRSKLLHKTELIPHLLSMTATPIPRTLAMTIYGDLDLSLIKELPKGRKKVETDVVSPDQRSKTYELIRKEIQKGRQAFVICPRIEKTEKTKEGPEVKTVTEVYETLSKEVFPELEVEMLHGKMALKEKEQVMRRFHMGKIDVLVSTSVIEVGVDISNATVIMIEGADRFGLAQLHQFRGRVGRGEHQSYCFLFLETGNPDSNRRLSAMKKMSSGFELAEQDLKIRGPGDFSGVKQWGLPDFAMRQILNIPLVEEAREAAIELVEKDIELKNYPELKARVEELREKLHLE